MFEQLKAEYEAWVKGKYIKSFGGRPDCEPFVVDSFRSTPAGDYNHSARWHWKEGDELGDEPHGYRQRDLERSR